MTKTSEARTVRLDIASRFEMLEVVQTVLASLANLAGFDEDEAHYLSVALRESVVNAIKHGNKMDEKKRVHVSFTLGPKALDLEVRDEGGGFEVANVLDPLAPENLLKADGRGIFFMRSFVDEVRYSFPPGGGTVVHMRKAVKAAS
jgi:serine/threonine-protein kinase RsbW